MKENFMTKVDIKRLDSITKNDTTATEQINDNFKALQEAIENTLSRDGTGPNFMDADLDMNSYRIINSANPVEDNDIVNLKYVEERIGGAVESAKTATAAATQAANSAQSALVSSTNAINTLRNAEEQLNNVIQYVDEAKQTIDETIDAAVEDVKQQALDAAQESIDTAAEQATEIVIDYANNELKPLLNEIAANAEADAENAAESAEIASNESEEAKHWAEDARVWSTGEDAEVEEIAPGEEEHSSRGYADLAMAIANTPEDVPVDTSKLLALDVIKGPKGEKGDKGDKGEDGKDGVDGKSVFDGYATNCITEIPQDIKLELNNGVLTLKAGSKVYVPNGKNDDGSLRFGEIVLSADKTFSVSGGTGVAFIVYYPGDGTLKSFATSIVQSGTSFSVNDGLWYDTTNNYIKRVTGSSPSYYGLTFPVCKIQITSGAITSIDQVFNGFGYIGSTVFALPGVKGLIPNGRNEDGSLRNIEYTSDKLTMQTLTSETTGAWSLGMWNDGGRVAGTNVKYDSYSNKMVGSTRGTCVELAYFTATNGVITSFTPKNTFHAVDRNDSSWVAGQAMPSGKYIDLILGASGTTYTAPANGWFSCSSDGVVNLLLSNQEFSLTVTGASGYAPFGYMPVKKGEKFVFSYSGNSNNKIRFFYVEGEE